MTSWTNGPWQGASTELLCSLFYNDQARAQVLKHRGAKGVSVCRFPFPSPARVPISLALVIDYCWTRIKLCTKLQ